MFIALTCLTCHFLRVCFQFIGPAKLPRGVSVIREHLRETDNVPLLVPLFTDANPAAMKEMVRKIQ